ncbi:MAG: class I SAM-dependent methyltransferase [Roseovarius sp.]|nr:class I SAM-dependent methyltransferase [Roseovarius sp.]
MRLFGRKTPAGAAGRGLPSVWDFFYKGPDVAGDIREKYGYDGDLLRIFTGTSGAMVHKWHHYIPVYDRYFSRFRGTGVRFLEIGVSQGGSMRMWREYFGPEATIYGVDIDPGCARFDGEAGQVRIGSQDDAAFLGAVVQEMGGVDIVLDDGSHMMPHVRKTLDILFPLLAQDGLYMIEDLHTAYWPDYKGGFSSRANFFRDLGHIFDDMHRWYHARGVSRPGVGDAVSAVHVHDSIAVFEKAPVWPPVHSQVGKADPPEGAA